MYYKLKIVTHDFCKLKKCLSLFSLFYFMEKKNIQDGRWSEVEFLIYYHQPDMK